jgi:hypothetical protein
MGLLSTKEVFDLRTDRPTAAIKFCQLTQRLGMAGLKIQASLKATLGGSGES